MIGQPADFPQPESPDSPSRSCKRVPRSTSEPRRRDKLTEPRASSVRQRNLRRTEPARRRRSASSAVTSHRSLPWTSSMDFFHGFLPWTSSMDFFHGPLPGTSSTDSLHDPLCWIILLAPITPPRAAHMRRWPGEMPFQHLRPAAGARPAAQDGPERFRKAPKGPERFREVPEGLWEPQPDPLMTPWRDRARVPAADRRVHATGGGLPGQSDNFPPGPA